MPNSIKSNSAEGIILIKNWEKLLKERNIYRNIYLNPKIATLLSMPSDKICAYFENDYLPVHKAFQERNEDLKEAEKILPFDFNSTCHILDNQKDDDL